MLSDNASKGSLLTVPILLSKSIRIYKFPVSYKTPVTNNFSRKWEHSDH